MKKTIFLMVAAIFMLTAFGCADTLLTGGSCDLITSNGICYEYGENYTTVEAETACTGATGVYSEEVCLTSTASCIGKCANNTQIDDVVIYYYDTQFTETSAILACTNVGGAWTLGCP
ncbi:MAG: hypothetical protein OEZ22_15015 [Spirochaetia bacterium]|nr:hypothetical protein [Spirochaetia bacterium]